ncbi:MAG: U32 family peptidase [Kiritimatiellae bacterium]|nr:U32 family peptidase [Kiritimatiellia bacterium]
MREIELLSPAGSFETARAAFAAGADAVYLGLDAFSARAEAVNFSPDELRQLLAYARASGGKKVYVTFNTLVNDEELPSAVERLAILDDLRPDGLIVQDLGVARLVRQHFPSFALHASTQLVAHNLEGVLAMKELGFVRVVLARELSLEEIQSIAKRCGVEIEVFVHGALCYSVSGLCLFSALEKERSGNRGRCAYCCRLACTDASGKKSLPFSMRDLRLDDRLDALRSAGVASLKIEGRMKSALYVASVTKRYREILDGVPPTVSRADLETVFSRRTTGLYIDGTPTSEPVIDPQSLGHLGTPVGTVKRITKDRDGISWLRFHTSRALERHDGLQFAAPEGGKPYGFGIADMRLALSRSTVFSVPADSDVEVRVPPDRPLPDSPALDPLQPGATVYNSASNAVKRRFAVPPFRRSDYPIGAPVDLTVTLSPSGITVSTSSLQLSTSSFQLSPAQHPERTADAVRKAFSRLGDTNWTLGSLTVNDPDGLFAPASILNDLRRQLVAKLDSNLETSRRARIADIINDLKGSDDLKAPRDFKDLEILKLRLGQPLPEDVADFDEVIFAVGHARGKEIEAALAARCAELRASFEEAGAPMPSVRLALPVFTHERDFGALRAAVKHMANLGIDKWEAADLATLRMLLALGLTDITADWTLYAFNAAARRQLADLGVLRHVASPESRPTSSAAGACIPLTERLVRQSTPLFISLTRPETTDPSRLVGLAGDTFAAYPVDGLWITTRPEPRRYPAPPEAPRRVDLSWDR